MKKTLKGSNFVINTLKSSSIVCFLLFTSSCNDNMLNKINGGRAKMLPDKSSESDETPKCFHIEEEIKEQSSSVEYEESDEEIEKIHYLFTEMLEKYSLNDEYKDLTEKYKEIKNQIDRISHKDCKNEQYIQIEDSLRDLIYIPEHVQKKLNDELHDKQEKVNAKKQSYDSLLSEKIELHNIKEKVEEELQTVGNVEEGKKRLYKRYKDKCQSAIQKLQLSEQKNISDIKEKFNLPKDSCLCIDKRLSKKEIKECRKECKIKKDKIRKCFNNILKIKNFNELYEKYIIKLDKKNNNICQQYKDIKEKVKNAHEEYEQAMLDLKEVNKMQDCFLFYFINLWDDLFIKITNIKEELIFSGDYTKIQLFLIEYLLDLFEDLEMKLDKYNKNNVFLFFKNKIRKIKELEKEEDRLMNFFWEAQRAFADNIVRLTKSGHIIDYIGAYNRACFEFDFKIFRLKKTYSAKCKKIMNECYFPKKIEKKYDIFVSQINFLYFNSLDSLLVFYHNSLMKKYGEKYLIFF